MNKLLERVTLVAGTVGPLTIIPQIYKMYSTQNASGVSSLSFFMFSALDIPFIIYGIQRKDKPITITYSLWFVANLSVAVGAVLYG